MRLPPFTFQREAHWLFVLAVLIPVLAMLLALLVPWCAGGGAAWMNRS
jgi:hypothetical protein